MRMDCISTLLQPSEGHDDWHKRAMDRIWSKATYRLSEVALSNSNRVMYYLADGLERELSLRKS